MRAGGETARRHLGVEDTPANAQVYAYATSPKHRHDLALSVDLVRKHVRPGAVIVADRAYCAYWMLALIQVLGDDALVRLHQARITGLGPGQKDKVSPW